MFNKLMDHIRNTDCPGVDQAFLLNVSKLLVEVDVFIHEITGIRYIKWDPKNYPESAKEEDKAEHYILVELSLANQPVLQYPSRTKSELAIVHCTTPGGVRGILRNRKILRIYCADECGGPAFVTYGFLNYGAQNYEWDMARVAKKALRDPKNSCNILVLGRAVGTAHTVKSGGIPELCKQVNDHLVVHERSTKKWGVHEDWHQITGILFAADGEWFV